jgi:hypothetical protein
MVRKLLWRSLGGVFALVVVSMGRSCAVQVGVLSARRARTRISYALVFSVGSNAFGHCCVVGVV